MGDNRIINNQIENNGHIKPDGTPRIGWYRREGIAIDASSEHYIAGNDISANAFGGILLYKNCWEHADDEPNSRPRTDHARANLIENNRFRDQPFGVWIAARQSRDLIGNDPTVYKPNICDGRFNRPWRLPRSHRTPYFPHYFRPDFAEDNEIIGNTFESIGHVIFELKTM